MKDDRMNTPDTRLAGIKRQPASRLGRAAGTWRLIGQTHADHGADHDTIVVKGPCDNFCKIKFKVTDAPLNMLHMS
jgi:hypothetical protein